MLRHWKHKEWHLKQGWPQLRKRGRELNKRRRRKRLANLLRKWQLKQLLKRPERRQKKRKLDVRLRLKLNKLH